MDEYWLICEHKRDIISDKIYNIICFDHNNNNFNKKSDCISKYIIIKNNIYYESLKIKPYRWSKIDSNSIYFLDDIEQIIKIIYIIMYYTIIVKIMF